MSSQLLVLSKNQIDIDFWHRIAEREGMEFKNSVSLDEISSLLKQNPDTFVLWDAESNQLKSLDTLFRDLGIGSRVFVITEGPARNYPELFQQPLFTHYLHRRYGGNAEFLCMQLVRGTLEQNPRGLEHYFQTVVARTSARLTSSSQKQSVIDDFRQLLLSHQIPTRLAEIGVDATDELLMNAIFDAPTDAAGVRYRRQLPREASFDLTGRETVEAELMIGPDLIGIRVVDQFGSLDSESTIRCLGKNFDEHGYVLNDEDPGAGLGISKLMKSALSLAFVVTPGVRTESIALIGNTRSFRELRHAFTFFSIQTGQA